MKSNLFGKIAVAVLALLTAGALALSLAGCKAMEITTDPTPPDDDPDGDAITPPEVDPARQAVWGTVNEGQTPLAGVAVAAGSSTTTTDNRGYYALYASPGTVTVSWTKDGYKAVTQSLNAVAGGIVRVDKLMEPRVPNEGFVVEPGLRRERLAVSPGRLEFDITGVPPIDQAPDKAHIAWGYEEGKGWTGGRGDGTGAEFGLRLYKNKCYSRGCVFAGEPRYDFAWARSKTVHVIIEWDRTSVRTNVGGLTTETEGDYPARWVIGIGWPPSDRDGVDGARYTHVRWPEGSVPLD